MERMPQPDPIGNIEHAEVLAKAAKPLIDMAREEWADPKDKEEMDNLAVRRGEHALTEYLSDSAKKSPEVKQAIEKWNSFYKNYFTEMEEVDTNFDNVVIPEKPESPSQLLMVAGGLTYPTFYNGVSKKLGKDITSVPLDHYKLFYKPFSQKDDRSTEKSYARWIPEKIEGETDLTFIEGLLVEFEYRQRTSRWMENKVICNGSRRKQTIDNDEWFVSPTLSRDRYYSLNIEHKVFLVSKMD